MEDQLVWIERGSGAQFSASDAWVLNRFLRTNPEQSASMQWDGRLAEAIVMAGGSRLVMFPLLPQAQRERDQGVFGRGLLSLLVSLATGSPSDVASKGRLWGQEIALAPPGGLRILRAPASPAATPPTSSGSSDAAYPGGGGEFGGGGASSDW